MPIIWEVAATRLCSHDLSVCCYEPITHPMVTAVDAVTAVTPSRTVTNWLRRHNNPPAIDHATVPGGFSLKLWRVRHATGLPVGFHARGQSLDPRPWIIY